MLLLVGKRACTGYEDGVVKVWDLKAGTALHTFTGKSSGLNYFTRYPLRTSHYPEPSYDRGTLISIVPVLCSSSRYELRNSLLYTGLSCLHINLKFKGIAI